LSKKELSRVEVMGRVKARSLRLIEAAELMGLSYRQSKRSWARYRAGGAQGPAARQLWSGVEPGVPGRVPRGGAEAGEGPL
jgi:hypothetical protein